ncbi:alpha-L-rhamnosidase [uncultured Chitinophaga sp.]|jgi:Alpha-L-rhamnosidase N-terminal domain./Bacterial alpha-L-rhamnosidase.|uniref:alpha-L-rhamnosidase n=1 Tax=uncultured Chitinophaga sp. TaxID=339340 RepID=UPI00260AEE58|nr:alpha-L-rhamnosidase [uncultured Chitinophaga sp.]
MKRRHTHFLNCICCIAGLFFLLPDTYSQGSCVPAGLQCEYLPDPVGIDAARPRFSWRLEDERPAATQSAYQLFVSTDPQAVEQGNVWTSPRISGNTRLAVYAGRALQPFTRYYWKIAVWDKDGKRSLSPQPASFETGMMDMKNWKGAWISDNNDVALKPAPLFRKVFETGKKVRSARAYIAVAGLYELYLNGERIGNHRLDPMFTRFDRRTLYVTYDVTPQLKAGKNAIGVMLGNGWYNHQSTAVWNFHEAPWRNRPAFCLDLRITYEDGSVETISSGKDWKTSLGPVIFNSIYTAEHYDARKEQAGWNTVAFSDTAWKEVIFRAAPSTNIVAQALRPIELAEEIPAKTLTKLNDTTYVFDLGRNIAGISSIRVSGPAGTVLRLKHAEQLTADGHADQSNIDVHYRPRDDKDPFQTDIFILSGKGRESFMPRFNYKGFQYVEVTSSQPVELTRESLSGHFMHSNVPPVGHIHTSNPMINQLWEATNNSYLSNLFGYPTDCPQREKNGWTGDAHIAIETGLYNFDGITVYEKWLADHQDEQQPNGVLPSIIPTGGWGYEWGNGPDWTSTIAIIPWNIYLFYGDTCLLGRCYNNIKRYVDHITEISPNGLTTWGLGDWVPVRSATPVELTSSVYYFTDVRILSKAAGILGHREDQQKYTALAEKIRQAINTKYLDSTTGIYGKGVQTELSVPLYWGVTPDALKAKVAANLARRVEQDSFHLDVGLLGTKAILNALSENGYADVAYKVASQETFPSWGWWIVNGATTLYENWPIDAKSDISRNHIMFGEIGAWLYKGIGGIRPDEKAPGFRHILLEPHFVAGLNSYTSSHKSPYGNIVSAWERTGETIVYTVTVPAGATASIRFSIAQGKQVYGQDKMLVNSSKPFEVSAGKYRFEIR